MRQRVGAVASPPTMFIESFPVMARSDAQDSELRALLDALDGGEQDDRAEEAAAALGVHRSKDVPALLRAQLRRATEEVGPTELTRALRERLTEAEAAAEEDAARGLYFALGARRSLVRRIAEALAERRTEEGWSDLARVATEHPSAVVRAAAAGALLGVRGDDGSDARAPTAPKEHLQGLVAAVGNRENDTWSIELRRYGAEAAMVIDPRTAFDRLGRYLVHGAPGDADNDGTVRGIASAWYSHMKPGDDPRFAVALCQLLDAELGVPLHAKGALKREETPEAVTAALAALERVIAGERRATPYLFEALDGCHDPRVVPALSRALESPHLDGVVIAILRALEKLDDPSALPAVEARGASLAAGDKRLKFFKAALKSLGRHGPTKPKATKAPKEAEPRPVAPGLPLWYAPPALSAPRGDDADLAALLAAMPAQDAQRKLAKRRDPAAAAAVRARLLEAADGLCDYTWDEALVQTLAPAMKGKARKAHTALYGPINERLALVRALAVDVARRWDPEGDAALVGMLAGHRYPALADELAPSRGSPTPRASTRSERRWRR